MRDGCCRPETELLGREDQISTTVQDWPYTVTLIPERNAADYRLDISSVTFVELLHDFVCDGAGPLFQSAETERVPVIRVFTGHWR